VVLQVINGTIGTEKGWKRRAIEGRWLGVEEKVLWPGVKRFDVGFREFFIPTEPG